ncbi:HAMP domain-containing sensor histidine kinase [Azospirillum sp. INR13]|uniref:sensor histidine kinase n=1 Tax=Azospirillum sp. INR13 TaxID=2596919 RepID=UPI0018922A17|nr:GAF domain-containing sensor histidine kinase [Azospirillum sp. INR13]
MGVLHIDRADAPRAATTACAGQHIIALARRLSYAATLEEVMGMVAQTARLVLQADGITFVLREGDRCHYAEEDAIAPLWRGKRFPMSACISGHVMLTGEAVSIADIHKDRRIPQDAYRATFVRSMAMVPVRKEDPLAALGAYWRDCRAVPDHDLERLQEIADTAALAILNLALRRTDRQQARFVSALTHSLHQPLQSLYLLAGVLDKQVREPAARATLGRIDCELTDTRSLLDDVRTLSGCASGGVAPVLTDVAVADILHGVAAGHSAAAAAKGVRLSVVSSDAMVRSEPALLARMLGCLVDTSIRHTDRGEVRVMCREDGDLLRISVDDTGTGVAADGLDLIMDTPFPPDGAQGRRHPMTLRLSIVRSLGALLGHGVEIASRQGKGSQVTLSIALSRAFTPSPR